MKKFSLLLGTMFLLSLPLPAVAASGGGLFKAMLENAGDTASSVYPQGNVEQFIIDAMRAWKTEGIILTSKDVKAAVDQNRSTICSDDKVNRSGKPFTFVESICSELIDAILSLIEGEREAYLLGKDLLMITNGAELSTADLPNRPTHMAHTALLLRRVWSGTGAGTIPWDEANDDRVKELQTALDAEVDLDAVVLRFQHGLFRARREADPTFAGVGNDVGEQLQNLANALGISDNETAVGEFAVPKLQGNIGFWATKSDIGLFWIYPASFAYPRLRPAGTYPVMVRGGENLAYPFSYAGPTPSANKTTPLCSRPTAGEGYLCRPQTTSTENCASSGDESNIILTLCSKTQNTHDVGPTVCKDLQNLYVDDGTPLTTADDTGKLNPALIPADTASLCTPETKTLYQDEIVSHACYISHCIEQSMNGHTLTPGRSPTLVNEATSPYLACMRTDPQLGVYAEVAEDSPYPLPPYLGHSLVGEFEQYYCAQGGKTAHPVLGFCRYRTDASPRNPPKSQILYAEGIIHEEFATRENQDNLAEVAMNIGYRVGLEQTLTVNRKVFATLAGLVQQIADLLGELKRAPITQAVCPWTGPFSSSSSASL